MNLLDHLYAFARRRHAKIYLVGGSVRDALLNRNLDQGSPIDIDVSVEGDASALARAMAEEIGAAFYVMNEEFDVARVILKEDARSLVDFARLRGESIEQDLATRDFSVNAMAADISRGGWNREQIIDPFNGVADLQARHLRAISESVFENDPVRLLRAVRLTASLDFSIDTETESLVRRDARRLARASTERVRDEFYKIMALANPARNLARLDELGLLDVMLPEVTWLKGVTQSAPHTHDVFTHSLHAVGALAETQNENYFNLARGEFAAQLEKHFTESVSGEHRRGVLLRIALLLHDLGKRVTRTVDPDGRIRFFGHEEVGAELVGKIFRRLHFSNEETALATTIVAHHLRPLLLAESGVSDRAVYRYFRASGDAGVDIAVHSWCDQRATYGETERAEAEAALQVVIARLLDSYYHAREKSVAPPSLVTGHDVMQILRIGPSKRVGEILEIVREAQAMGQVTTRAQALNFIRQYGNKEQSDDAACD